MGKSKISVDPYAGIRRDNPPPDFTFKPKTLYNRKPRKHVKRLIEKELEQFFEERKEE